MRPLRRNPEGRRLSGRSALSRRSPMGACHGLRVASRISSRKASVAATWDLFRGSLGDKNPIQQPRDQRVLNRAKHRPVLALEPCEEIAAAPEQRIDPVERSDLLGLYVL